MKIHYSKCVHRCRNNLLFEHPLYRQTKTITISCTEYSRLLHDNVQMMKFKEACKAKSNEVKSLQSQLMYYKKRAVQRNNGMPVEDHVDDSSNVI